MQQTQNTRPQQDRTPGVTRAVSGVRNLILQFDQPEQQSNAQDTHQRKPLTRTRSKSATSGRFTSPSTSANPLIRDNNTQVRFAEAPRTLSQAKITCPLCPEHQRAIFELQEKIRALEQQAKVNEETIQNQKKEIEMLKSAPKKHLGTERTASLMKNESKARPVLTHLSKKKIPAHTKNNSGDHGSPHTSNSESEGHTPHPPPTPTNSAALKKEHQRTRSQSCGPENQPTPANSKKISKKTKGERSLSTKITLQDVPNAVTSSTESSEQEAQMEKAIDEQNEEDSLDSEREDLPSKTPVSNLEATKDNFMNTHKHESWVISYSDLVVMEKIGKGVSSTVYKGSWKNQHVAIKVLHLLHDKDFKDFTEEIAIMNKVQSPHLVRFFGATLEQKITCVMELCANGSLFHRLQDSNTLINWERVLKWAHELVQGINVLHEWTPVILHRDLKTLNLLLDADWVIKICDFGLSRFNTEASASQTLTKLRGTYSYTAPEMYFKSNYTTKSDVFSIGIMLWEMSARLLGGKYVRPYSEFKEIKMDYQIIFKVATKELRPTIPETCPEDFKKTIQQCWSADPDLRPSCKQLLEIIAGHQKHYKKKKAKWKKTEAKA